MDEGGVTDFDLEGELKILHAACADKIDAMKEKHAPEFLRSRRARELRPYSTTRL